MAEDRLDDSLKWDELREMVEQEMDTWERDNYMSQVSKATTQVAAESYTHAYEHASIPQLPSMPPQPMPSPAMQPLRPPVFHPAQPALQAPIPFPQPNAMQMPQPPQPVPAPSIQRQSVAQYPHGQQPANKEQWIKNSRWSFDGRSAMPGAIAERLGKPKPGSMENTTDLVPPQAPSMPNPARQQQRASNAGALDPNGKTRGSPGSRQPEIRVIDVPRGPGAGNVGGIGMLFEKRSWEPYFRITGLLEGGTAQAHGVRVDDFLLEVNAQPISGLTAKQVTGRILGVPGTPVRLKTANPYSLVVPQAGRPSPGPHPHPASPGTPPRAAEPTSRPPPSPALQPKPHSSPALRPQPQQPQPPQPQPQQARVHQPQPSRGSPPALDPVFPVSQDAASLSFLAQAKAAANAAPSPLDVPAPSQAAQAPGVPGPASAQVPLARQGSGRPRQSTDLDSLFAIGAVSGPGPGPVAGAAGSDSGNRRWRDKSGFSMSAPQVTAGQMMHQLERGAI